jgi:DNA-binding beta-propeller fold protein YncE
LSHPCGVAVDGAGNVYITDTSHGAVKEWNAASNTVSTLVSGLNLPEGVTVDGGGNVYIADTDNNAIKEWNAASNTVSTLVSSGLRQPYGVAVDEARNVYIADADNGAIKELPRAFVVPTARNEGALAGSDRLPVVLPPTANLLAPFTPTTDQSWLSITGITNGVVCFSFTAAPATNRTAYITLLGQSIAINQGPAYTLGATNLVVGPAAGTDSVVLGVTPPAAAWTAATNAIWLHLSAANQNGVGPTNIIFTYDANPGATRAGTLTVAGQTLTVVQAGSSYVAAPAPVTALVSSGLSSPYGAAVDGLGNVYFVDFGNNAIKEWDAASDTVSTLVSSGLSRPCGLAADGAGNLYIADSGDNAIKEWNAASNTVSTLISSGLSQPYGVAVDGQGNVYIADAGNNAIKEWNAASNTVSTLVSSGLANPRSVAVDGAGNVYIADTDNNAIKEWNAVSNTVGSLVSSGLSNPQGVTVDGAGNVYISDTFNNAVRKWNAASRTVSALVSSGLSHPNGIAVDGARNVYFADGNNNAIKELPRAFVVPTARNEGGIAGCDSLPVVLPATANLLAPFTPTSDQSWLSITGSTNGVVSFSFTASPITNRAACITLLGAAIAINQGPVFTLGVTNLVEGPASGTEIAVLGVAPSTGIWTATANATWLHLSAANQSGVGSANVVFTFDANPGATRTGTLTIAGRTLTLVQAGSGYVAAAPITALVSSGLNQPAGVAVDGAGNVYIADTGNNAIKKWNAASQTVSTLVSSGLSAPQSVAVDGGGNVYIADTYDEAIKEWNATGNTVSTLVSSACYYQPFGVAVDAAGNVYLADGANSAIREWIAASNTISTLVSSGLNEPFGVAVDGQGNVYVADTFHNAIKEWNAAGNTVSTLVSPGLNQPGAVAVDGAGNVYIADSGNNAIKEWNAAGNTVSTLVSSGLNEPYGVAVDGARNVYIADTGDNAIKELPRAFVDAAAKTEPGTAGTDTLSPVLPANENLLSLFAPATDQPWLAIIGITNDVVSFSFLANPGAPRIAHLTVLGQTVSVTQATLLYPSAPVLAGSCLLANGTFQVCFTNLLSGAGFTLWSATNLTTPWPQWTALRVTTNCAAGLSQFMDTNQGGLQRFYRISSP